MISTFRRSSVATLALVLAMALAARSAAAQPDYPTRPITLIVGFAAGGFADALARLVGGKLSERLGQNVIIENRGGAGGNIAAAAVARAPADGHTLLVTTTGLAVNETLTRNKGFAADDLKAISIPASAPETLSVNASHPAKTLAELIQAAQRKPINYGSPGVGTASHIAAAYFFKVLANVNAVHVPFQGGAPALNAALGGHVEALVGSIPGYASNIQSGALRGLAIANDQRLPQVSNVPTYAESGYPGFFAATWSGFFVPAATSDAITVKLNKTIDDIIRAPDVQERLKSFHMQVRYGDQRETAAYFKSEIATWAKMIVTIGLTGN